MGKNKEKKQVDPEAKIGIGKFWAWQSRELSDAAIAFLVGYISLFCTDVIKVNPLTVGTVLMVTKIIDGITDVLAGYIVDRTNTKWGKGRPYDFCLIGTWGSFLLLFACPTGWSDVAKIAWVAVFYVLANAVFMTFLNAGEVVFKLRAFNRKQIIRFTAFGGLATSLGGLIVGMIMPQLIEKAGDDQKKWISAVAMVGIPLALIGMCRFLFVREKHEVTAAEADKEKVNLKEIFTMFTKNHYLMLYACISMVSNIASNIGIGVYYFKWVLGDLGLQGIFAAFSALAVVALVILPKLMKKFSVKQILMGGLVLGIAANLVSFVFYKNIPVLIVCYILNMVATVPGVYISSILMLDNADYNEYLGMHRMEGSMGSLNGFMGRVGSSLGAFLLGIILTVVGYDANAAVQSDFTLMGFRVVMYIFPVISYLIQFILWRFYDLEKKLPEIRATLEARRAGEKTEA